jgi:uncharacterized protein (TIGR03790 family)
MFTLLPQTVFLAVSILAIVLLPGNVAALQADEVLVVANSGFKDSVALAKFYMLQRNIPPSNLVLLDVTHSESCSRNEYDQKIAKPIRLRLERQINPGPKIRCLLLMRGVPLKISSLFDKTRTRLKALQDMEFEISVDDKKTSSKDKKESGLLEKMFDSIERKMKSHHILSATASVDSELMLVQAETYPLEGWIPNPYFLGFKDKNNLHGREDVLMVSRLDGPTAGIVRRIITDSIAAEKSGLQGKAYFDARWPVPAGKITSAYQLYDLAIHRAAQIAAEDRNIPVVINDNEGLFQPGEGSDATLYCGWYSLEKYIDAFEWQRGAVGYHIASYECRTLRDKESRAWCKMMLEKGVAATVGPVSEPYITAFPYPDIFFGFLVDGYLTLAECYLISTAYLSWKMVLIGDPLYRPFYRMRE